MDCASEEQLIRMKLSDIPAVAALVFDIPNRSLAAYHEGDAGLIDRKINELNLGSSLLHTAPSGYPSGFTADADQWRLLWIVLFINGGCFVLEMTVGWFAGSMGLIAESLDMLADALVYGLSLYAVGGSVLRKKRIAKASGVLQIMLAVLGLGEVTRRFLGYEHMPDFGLMILVSLIALLGNSISLWLLQKSKSDDAHIRASMIFTSNDVIINIGVIAAAVAGYLTRSNRPDLIIGILVFAVVIRGAIRILKL